MFVLTVLFDRLSLTLYQTGKPNETFWEDEIHDTHLLQPHFIVYYSACFTLQTVKYYEFDHVRISVIFVMMYSE